MKEDTWSTRLNLSIETIEANLHRPLSLVEVARTAYASPFHFQRVFQALTGVTVGHYVRARRLSLAASELVEKRRKVGEVALEFGYESPEAFSRAFRRHYGISPSLARRQRVALAPFTRLVLAPPPQGRTPMQYEIIEKPAFKILGTSRHFKTEDESHMSQIPAFWDEVIGSGELGKISEAAGPGSVFPEGTNLAASYGAICDEGSFDYLIGFESTQEAKAPHTLLDVPAATWAVFPAVGDLPNSIQNVWKQIYAEFFPSPEFDQLVNTPELEVYPDEEMGEDYVCEVWIPVKRKA